ncbi:hypothetical protein A6U98_14695 [Rhizobium sp. WYCCWR10014]|nr:hypothetical protein A6U98_14695 [Rhizobium sp. WYCCWR10014]
MAVAGLATFANLIDAAPISTAPAAKSEACTYAEVWLGLSLDPTRPYPSTQSIANTPPCSVVDAAHKAAVRRRQT